VPSTHLVVGAIVEPNFHEKIFHVAGRSASWFLRFVLVVASGFLILNLVVLRRPSLLLLLPSLQLPTFPRRLQFAVLSGASYYKEVLIG